MKNNRKYKPNIDGLRAISIIAVFIYHLKLENSSQKIFFLQGGYLGVDIFFLISGFLIAEIIFEAIKINKFSLLEFYFRRLKRILPALVFLILFIVTLFIFLNVIDHPDRESFVHSSIFSVIGISNFFFFHSGTIYGNSNDILEPLLHTWSLSIELQFYIFFPIFLFLCLKTKFKNHLNIIFIIIFLISIIATFYLKNDPHLSFYSPITRGWCFALGILAFLNKDKLQKFIILKLDNICLITIIICFFFFNNKTWHPSIFTLIPISCATYLILSKNNQTISYKVLTNKFSLKIGIISYSLYLWHFPIISFHRHLYIENHISSVLSIIFFTILFSLASYNFIEKYFRSKKFNENIIFLIFLISLLFTFNIWLKKNNFYEYNTPKKLRFDELQDLKLMMDKKLCMDNECIFNPNYKKKIYLIGDSVFEDISVKLLPKLEKNKYNINTYFKSGCFLFPDHNKINIYTNKVEKNCSKNEQIKILNILEKTENSIIIFHARYALYLLEKEFNNNEGGIEKVKWEYKFLNENKESNHFVNFSKFVKKISKKNKIILIYPLPEVGWDLPRRVKFIEFKNKLLNDNKQVTTSYEIFKERNKEVFKILDNIKGPNIQRLYPHKKLCDYKTGRCITQKDNHLLYRDYVHLTKHGVKLILNDLLKLIENKN